MVIHHKRQLFYPRQEYKTSDPISGYVLTLCLENVQTQSANLISPISIWYCKFGASRAYSTMAKPVILILGVTGFIGRATIKPLTMECGSKVEVRASK